MVADVPEFDLIREDLTRNNSNGDSVNSVTSSLTTIKPLTIDSKQIGAVLNYIDINNIDLNVFALSKRYTRKLTFMRLSKRMLEDNVRGIPGLEMSVLESFL